MPDATCDIGLIGLAVMGQNLVLNMTDHGFKVAVFNRTTSKVDEFLAHEAKDTSVEGAHSVAELCAKLKRPRRVMIMNYEYGDVVEPGYHDEIIAPPRKGRHYYRRRKTRCSRASNRRTRDLAEKGILFIGTGVSGGEEGARFGRWYARRKSHRLAPRQGHLPVHRGQGGRRHTML